MMANVTDVARWFFRIVASIYKPFSVNAFGSERLFGDRFVVVFFDRKSFNSSVVITNIICELKRYEKRWR